jgi:hypothetical protein
MPNGRDFIFVESSGVLAAPAPATSKLLAGSACWTVLSFFPSALDSIMEVKIINAK